MAITTQRYDWLNGEKWSRCTCDTLFGAIFAKWRREIFIFEVLTTTRPQSSKSLFLCFYMKTIRAKQPKVYYAYFMRVQHGIIAKHYTKRMWRIICTAVVISQTTQRGDLALLFCMLRQRNVRKCLLLGQHDYSHFIQPTFVILLQSSFLNCSLT